MQELEKILEEIDQEKKNAALSIRHTTGYKAGQIRMAERIEEIIRKHMNDSQRKDTFEFDFSGVKSFDCQCGRHYVNTADDRWISVEERLPEEGGTYIITAKDGEREIISFAKWQNRYKHFDMTGKRAYWRVIAWRPLPEPCRLERSENHDGE